MGAKSHPTSVKNRSENKRGKARQGEAGLDRAVPSGAWEEFALLVRGSPPQRSQNHPGWKTHLVFWPPKDTPQTTLEKKRFEKHAKKSPK